MNVAGDFPSANALTTCDTCGIANSEANPQNSSCVCKGGHHFALNIVTTSSGSPSDHSPLTKQQCSDWKNSQYPNANWYASPTSNYNTLPDGCSINVHAISTVYWQNHNGNTGISCSINYNCVILSPQSGNKCTACAAGTYRVGGDSVDGNATTCEACPAEHFSLEGSKECTAWTTCAAGLYLASPSATQDGTCTPCAAGTFQPDSDSIAQSCQACAYNTHSADGASSCTDWAECTGETHYNEVRITGEEHCDANYVCSANSTLHTAPTSTSDRICACEAGHFFDITPTTTQTSGVPPNPSPVSLSECQAYANRTGADFYSDSWSSAPSGCQIWTNSGSVAYNTNGASSDSCNAVEKCIVGISDKYICQPCPVGTSRVAGDLSNNNATTCAACAAGSFSDSAAAATCTAYSEADCDKGLELVTSGKQAPLLTEDASCSACVEGKWQPLDSTTNLCQTHTDLSCDASTEVGDGTSSVDSAQCVCKGGHSSGETYKLVTSGVGSSHTIVTATECENLGYSWQGSVSLSSYPYGCVIVDGVSAYYNTLNTQVTCGSQVQVNTQIYLSTVNILPEVITETECSTHASNIGYPYQGYTVTTVVPRGCVRIGGGANVYFNRETTSTVRCNAYVPNYSFAGMFCKRSAKGFHLLRQRWFGVPALRSRYLPSKGGIYLVEAQPPAMPVQRRPTAPEPQRSVRLGVSVRLGTTTRPRWPPPIPCAPSVLQIPTVVQAAGSAHASRTGHSVRPENS